MKVRTLRKRNQRKMDKQPWLAWENDITMYRIRHVKPCKGYSPYCADCNAVLFRKEMARFPYNIVEFNEYEQAKQDLHDPQPEAAYVSWHTRSNGQPLDTED